VLVAAAAFGLGRVFSLAPLPSSFIAGMKTSYIYVSMQLPHRGVNGTHEARLRNR